MEKLSVLDKYPVFVEELAKADTDCADAAAVIAQLRTRVEAHPGSVVIAEFDHYAHVMRQPEHRVAEDIRDSRHLLFCLANAIPNPLVPAVRPRSISVVEYDDRFVIAYLEAPAEGPNQAMAAWVAGLRRA